MSFQNILQYKLCIKCNNNIAKVGTNYCKKCQIKPIKTVIKKDNNRKIYYYKFQDRNTKARLLLNNFKSNIGYSLCIGPSNQNVRGFQPIENNELFLNHTWDQFRSLKEFTACIIQSDRISFPYFILSCNTLIQSHPKFQQFIQHRDIELPSNSLFQDFILPYPLTNALQLICKANFWEELISIYFKKFHPVIPLFSIRSFDPKKTSPSLLSAIHFCAYQFSRQQPREVSEYMDKLALQNIKKIVKKATMDNVRALVIHMFIAQLGGKLTLAKSLQAHLTRMSYLLGLHLNCSKLSPIELYNRNLLFNAIRVVNIRLTGSHNFSPSYMTEFGKEGFNLYDPKWQLPSPSSPIYFENQMENQLYSICIAEYSKFCDTLIRTIYIPSFFTLETNTFNRIWNSKVNRLKEIFKSTIQIFEDLKTNFSEFGADVDVFQTHMKISYYDSIIDIYEMLKHKNKSLKPCEISATLDHCHNLYKVLSTMNDYNPYFQFHAHIIGLHYLNIYPKCAPNEKLRTKQRLEDLIQFIEEKFSSSFSLNYLLLKTGYDTLVDN